MDMLKDIEQMGKKLYPTYTLKQAKTIVIAWNHIDPSLTIGPLTSEALSADVDTVQGLQQRIAGLQSELLDLRNQRDTAFIGIWDKVKRARAGFKAAYGDDSSEYEIVGGTRLRDRKPPRRKASPQLNNEDSPPPGQTA
jgi:hypothetical protein